MKVERDGKGRVETEGRNEMKSVRNKRMDGKRVRIRLDMETDEREEKCVCVLAACVCMHVQSEPPWKNTSLLPHCLH